MSDFLRSIAPAHATTKATSVPGTVIAKLLQPFEEKKYLLWYDPLSVSRKVGVSIVLKEGVTPIDQLTAWWHAIALAEASHQQDKAVKGALMGIGSTLLEQSMKSATALIVKHESALRELGWDLDTGALETGSNSRVKVQ